MSNTKFSVRKLSEAEGKEQYKVKISSRFPALENFVYDVDINRTWEINNSSDFLHSSDTGEKREYNDTVHQIFMDLKKARQILMNLKKANDSVRKEVMYNIHIEFWVPMKLDRLIKMYLN
jgi:hypothetical protein